MASAVALPAHLEPEPGARPAPPALGWLRSPRFDLGFILGVLALALLLGGVAAASPALFMSVLLADFWLLAYPHVASTFTRIAFDRESLRRHRFLLLALPLLVLAGTAGTAWLGGAVALNTLYFYWQSAHYARQSDGIARAYRRATGAPAIGRDALTDVVVYAFPIWGVLHRCAQRPISFYGAPFLVPPVPRALVVLAGVIALGALAAWVLDKARALRRGEPVVGYSLHVLSHVVMTLVSHFALEDITRGWLFINIWHNAQYLVFVWAANARKFERGVDTDKPFVSWLSQPRNVAWYAAVCGGLGAVFYVALGRASAAFPQDVLPVVLVAHLAVNFHHYLVDAVIWRTPRVLEPSRAGPRSASSLPPGPKAPASAKMSR